MATFSKITEQGIASSLNGSDYVVVVAGGTLKRITLDNLRVMMEENQQQFLDENAFYIEPNTASPRGAAYVVTGGNELVKQTWLSKITGVLMSPDGYYCRLNPNDSRYTIDGDQVVKEGAVVDAYTNADWMGMLDGGYWNYLQEVTIGGVKHIRHHIALVPLPGGWYTQNVPVGMYKCSVQSGKLRSIPFVQPSGANNIRDSFKLAQVRSKNHGLAGGSFRLFLLQYIMAKYGYRDVQNLQATDGTKIFGPGLDGTEYAANSVSPNNSFIRQWKIVTGACIALGRNDGNVAVLDIDNHICHSVNVGVWENPYGQYWEFDGHLCSVGTDVYQWDANFLPQVGAPTAADFANVAHTKFQRATENGSRFAYDMSLVTTSGAQCASYVPRQEHVGILYGDSYSYAANGQMWLVGGNSPQNEGCGLACVSSNYDWTASSQYLSARLDFHGAIAEVTSSKLKSIL